MASVIKFNNYNLNDWNNGIYTERVQHNKMPNRSIGLLDISGDDGVAITSVRNKEKIIELRTRIVKNSHDELKEAIDEFKMKLLEPNKYLEIQEDGESYSRRYLATLKDMDIVRNDRMATIEYSFVVPAGVGEEIGITSPVSGQLKNIVYNPGYYGYVNGSVGFEGTYSPKPVITIKLNTSFNYVEGFEFLNVLTNESLIIEGYDEFVGVEWLEGDEIVIDFKTKSVYYNDKEIEFKGVFPSFNIGTNYYMIKFGDIVIEEFIVDDIDNYDEYQIDSPGKVIAQSFVLKETYNSVSGIAVPLRKEGNPGNLKMWIYRGDEYPEYMVTPVFYDYLEPDETWYTFGASDVGYTDGWYQRRLSASMAFYAGYKYWLVAQASNVDSDNFYYWKRANIEAKNYSGGYSIESTDDWNTWNENFYYNLSFKILAGGIPEEGSIIIDIDYSKAYI